MVPAKGSNNASQQQPTIPLLVSRFHSRDQTVTSLNAEVMLTVMARPAIGRATRSGTGCIMTVPKGTPP